MSIVCQKCRRIVRDNTIYANEGNYYCSKCQKTYKLPQSFFRRDDLEIPVLSTNTNLKVQKTEDEMLIEFPRHFFTFAFKISSIVLFFNCFFLANDIYDTKRFEPSSFFLFSLAIFLVSLIFSSSKKYILVKDDSIIFYKKLFSIKIDKKQKVKNILKIKEIKIEDANQIDSSSYIEIYFKENEYWKVGYNLSIEDTKYFIAEMKLIHAYDKAINLS